HQPHPLAGYLDLVTAVAPGQRVRLVPDVGFPRSELDGRLRDRLVDALRRARWLPAAGGGELAPGVAEWLDLPGAPDALRARLAGAGLDRLVAADPAPPAALGVPRVTAAELVSRLFGVEQPPQWWRELYAELEPVVDTVPGLLDELRALPVPLADDRTAAGPATVLLPEPDAGPDAAPAVAALAALGLPGLHVAHAGAVHPLLARLGARAANPLTLLEHPALTEAVDRSVAYADAGLDPEPLAAAVLGLVAVVGDAPPALAALALPDSDGRPARADELMLPDAALRPLLAPDAGLDVLDATWAQRFDRSVLTAIGVVDRFAVLVEESPLGPDHDLHDEEEWWDGLADPPSRLVAVRDLDLVDDDAWPDALALLAGDRDTRSAVLAPGSYTAWWLARHARLAGHPPSHWRLPSAPDLAPLYDLVRAKRRSNGVSHARPLDDQVLGAIGVRADLRVRDTAEADDLLVRLSDPARQPDAALVARAHAALSEAVAAGDVPADELALPEQVRALDGSVVDVGVAVVLDDVWLGAVLPPGEVVVGGDPVALAELLDLPLASEVVAAEPVGEGVAVRWSALGEVVLACDVLGVPVPDGELVRHDDLVVDVTRPAPGRVGVPAWRDGSGSWHAADPLRALLGLLGGDPIDG
ncbi:MAG TPA: ATP-binding protein, partial [Pseudonocardia sp.]|nr:ATP-binding protein [Pseudonocardia sp.]